MHRMNPPVAAGSEELGTIVTVVSSAMKAICGVELREREGERKEEREREVEVERERSRERERENCAHLSLVCLLALSLLVKIESLFRKKEVFRLPAERLSSIRTAAATSSLMRRTSSAEKVLPSLHI